MTPEAYLQQFGVWIEATGAEVYELVGANVIFGKDAGIVVTVFGDNGLPSIGEPVVVNIRPDGKGDDPQKPDGSGVVRFLAGAASAYTPPQRGPFTITLVDSAEVDDQHYIRTGKGLSVSVRGMGDYLAQHTTWQLQFKKKGAVQPPTNVPTIKSADELRNLAYGAIYPTGISFLPTAALVVAARSHGLGVAVTNEGTFLDPAGRLNRWQAFSGGIVACLDGHYAMADFIVTPW